MKFKANDHVVHIDCFGHVTWGIVRFVHRARKDLYKNITITPVHGYYNRPRRYNLIVDMNEVKPDTDGVVQVFL